MTDASWPLPKLSFSVTGIPGNPVFQEVVGLENEVQTIAYRAGGSGIFAPIKMPGLQKVGNVTMKQGIFTVDADLWTWFSSIAMNTIARSTIVVSLCDQTGTTRMSWTLNNAFPAKLSGTDLTSDGNEVAVASIEIAFDTMTVAMT